MNASGRPALFLDRDGTIIVDEHYLNDAARVTLLPGAALAITSANTLNIPVVIITNQSGIGRGMITELQYQEVDARMKDLLAQQGARIDATYYCAEHPGAVIVDVEVPDIHASTIVGSDSCRKPSLFMYLQAASAHQLDLARSAYIGDKWRDVEPGTKLGAFGVLVPNGSTSEQDIERARLHARIAPDVQQAIDMALAWMGVTQ